MFYRRSCGFLKIKKNIHLMLGLRGLVSRQCLSSPNLSAAVFVSKRRGMAEVTFVTETSCR